MPVDFDGSADIIKFADNAIYDDLITKSISLRFIQEGEGNTIANRLLLKAPPDPAITGWDTYYRRTNDNMAFVQSSTGGFGVWSTDASTIVVDTPYSWGISMDLGNINNDPVFYLNGSSVTVNEDSTPSGAWQTDAGDGLLCGGSLVAAPTHFEGKIWDIHIANVIWTPAEFASLHASTAPGLWMRGLIFYAPMNGAAGIQEFDGAALGAANKVIDIISGILGTPTSNPLGVADTTLAV